MAFYEVCILGLRGYDADYLYQVVLELVKELNIDADVKYISDMKAMAKFRVIMTPAIAFNGKVRGYGRIVSRGLIKKWLLEMVKEEES